MSEPNSTKHLIDKLQAENAELLAKVETAKAESKNWQHSMGLAIEERDETIADLEYERESMPVLIGYIGTDTIEMLKDKRVGIKYIRPDNFNNWGEAIYIYPPKTSKESSDETRN